MNYDRLIRNWHIKASGEDCFSKYVFEYLAFIAFLRKRRFKYEKDRADRKTIQRLKQDDETKKTYLNKIQRNENLRNTWRGIINEFEQEPFHDKARLSISPDEYAWWNCSAFSNQKQDKTKRKGVIHDLEDWENMVEFWCCVRNNLFHGEKDPEHKRDEFAVKNGYETLKELVNILLAQEKTK